MDRTLYPVWAEEVASSLAWQLTNDLPGNRSIRQFTFGLFIQSGPLHKARNPAVRAQGENLIPCHGNFHWSCVGFTSLLCVFKEKAGLHKSLAVSLGTSVTSSRTVRQKAAGDLIQHGVFLLIFLTSDEALGSCGDDKLAKTEYTMRRSHCLLGRNPMFYSWVVAFWLLLW